MSNRVRRSITFEKEDLPRIDRIAKRKGLNRSAFVNQHVMRAVERAEREWARVERQVEQLSERDTEDLEALESRLLTKDRAGDTSEAEKHLLGAVQRILRERAGLPSSEPFAETA